MEDKEENDELIERMEILDFVVCMLLESGAPYLIMIFLEMSLVSTMS